MSKKKVHIIGGGLAGSEAAWQCLRRGVPVTLSEMRPRKLSTAHRSGNLAELVCSNTFKSLNQASAPGLLKMEMTKLDSLIVDSARLSAVPSGQALGVDRERFSQLVTQRLADHPLFERCEAEVIDLDDDAYADAIQIVATGPLTSDGLVRYLRKLCPSDQQLYFYDAIAPIIAADSIDQSFCFRSDRYGEPDSGDYLNIPLNKEEYYEFVNGILAAEKMPLHDFEDPKYFESCLPVEVMIDRGIETLRFGPMKPVGLTDPKTGRWPYAAIQLRQENREATMWSMVGFQTKMKWPEQERIFRSISALKSAEFLRLGSVHRNTYLNSPQVLNSDLSFKTNQNILLAGQLSGVEGYTESAAMGLLAGRIAAARILRETFVAPPKTTMMGALLDYVTMGGLGEFQPMNANLGLLPMRQKVRGVSKAQSKELQCSQAYSEFCRWADDLNQDTSAAITGANKHLNLMGFNCGSPEANLI